MVLKCGTTDRKTHNCQNMLTNHSKQQDIWSKGQWKPPSAPSWKYVLRNTNFLGHQKYFLHLIKSSSFLKKPMWVKSHLFFWFCCSLKHIHMHTHTGKFPSWVWMECSGLLIQHPAPDYMLVLNIQPLQYVPKELLVLSLTKWHYFILFFLRNELQHSIRQDCRWVLKWI